MALSNRTIITWLVVDVILSVLIGVTLAILSLQALRTADNTHREAVTQYQACQSGNTFRLQSKDAIEGVLDLFPATTPAAKKLDRRIIAVLDRNFVSEKCVKIGY